MGDVFGPGCKKPTGIVTEKMWFPIDMIMSQIMEEAIYQLVQFTRSLKNVRAMENIPISIGVDSKLHNYRVEFLYQPGFGGRDGFDVSLKNFDNEPPNLKIFHGGEPMYRGGPLYDMISRVFPDLSCRRILLTGFRKSPNSVNY